MESRIVFIIWLAILLLGQVSSRRKRQQKQQKKGTPTLFSRKISFPKKQKPPKPATVKQPEPFTCEQANEPEPAGPMKPKVKQDLRTQVQPVKSSLQDEITDLKPDVVPQVQEDQEPVTQVPVQPVLTGTVRDGMVWAMILGQPRTKESWAMETRKRYGRL